MGKKQNNSNAVLGSPCAKRLKKQEKGWKGANVNFFEVKKLFKVVIGCSIRQNAPHFAP